LPPLLPPQMQFLDRPMVPGRVH